jgi:aldose sugar dehydrogenase
MPWRWFIWIGLWWGFWGAGPVGAQAVRHEVLATGLEHPWAVVPLGAEGWLVTERPGRLKRIPVGGAQPLQVAGVPAVDAVGQGGLLDAIADSGFAHNRTLYLCYAEAGPAGEGNTTALATARLSDDGRRLEGWRVLFRQQPRVVSRLHFGCRVVESPDGYLFLTLGDRYHRMNDAQRLDNHLGKVVRLRKDGTVPADNPFVRRSGALPEIWSWGHRNLQGATWGPDGRLWVHEHGPQGGDEINRPHAGDNHGWPVVTWGENYGGGRIGDGLRSASGMVDPLHQWTPSVAPSGMAFVTSDRYGPAWRGNLLVGSLKFRHLIRLELLEGRVAKEHRLLENLGERIRDVRQGADGWVYVVTDSPQGQLIRLRGADLPVR